MNKQDHIRKEGMHEDDLPPVLKGLKDKNPYRVPEDYFRHLPGQIKARIAKEQMRQDKIRPLHAKLAFTASLAAAVIALLIMFYFIFKPGQPQSLKNHLASEEQKTGAIEDYLLNNQDIDEESITEAMTANLDSIPEITIVNPLLDKIDTTLEMNGVIKPAATNAPLTSDDIIQYLLDEDFDSEIDL